MSWGIGISSDMLVLILTYRFKECNSYDEFECNYLEERLVLGDM